MRFLGVILISATATAFSPFATSGGFLNRVVKPARSLTQRLTPSLMSLVPLESEEGGGDSASETFRVVYTCKRCSTRNMVEVKIQAWESGTVISTCQGCNVKHLLSDAKGLMDLGNYTNFSNVANDASMKVLDARGRSAEDLAAWGVGIDEASGNLTLVPQEGEFRVAQKERVSAVGPPVDPSLIVAPISDVSAELRKLRERQQQEAAENAAAAEAATGVAVDKKLRKGGGVGFGRREGQGRQDLYSTAMVVDLPAELEGGDLLQLATSTGIMMVSVPDVAPAGCRLEILGEIEFMVPEGQEGEVVLLETPSGDELPIAIPEGVRAGSFLKVGYPVKVLADPADTRAANNEKWE